MHFVTSNRDLINDSDDEFDDDSENDEDYRSDNDLIGGINASRPPVKITSSEDCDWMIW